MFDWSQGSFFGMIFKAIITADLAHLHPKYLMINLVDGVQERQTTCLLMHNIPTLHKVLQQSDYKYQEQFTTTENKC